MYNQKFFLWFSDILFLKAKFGKHFLGLKENDQKL